MPFLHSFEPGGVERVALRLAGAWAAAGCEVRIAMGRPGGALEGERPEGVDLLFPRRISRLAPRMESLWLVPHLVAMVRRYRPDVLFCAGNTYAIVAVLARLWLGRACPPIVCKVSNSLDRRDFGLPMRGLYAIWLWVQGLFIDRFVGLAEAMRPEMASALRIGAERLAVVYDPALSRAGMDRASALADAAVRAPGRQFLGVGRLAFQKNFALLITGFARIAGPGDRLVIVGEGPERHRLERLAARLGVVGQVDLPGHVPDVTPWLARADVFVLSSRYEGVPAAVLEALAVGVPIVATDCCVSMTELLAAGALGRLVPPGDAGALALAMDEARPSGAPAVAAMRAQAERFTVERSAARYLVVMESAIADHRAAQGEGFRAGLPRFGRPATVARSD